MMHLESNSCQFYNHLGMPGFPSSHFVSCLYLFQGSVILQVVKIAAGTAYLFLLSVG